MAVDAQRRDLAISVLAAFDQTGVGGLLRVAPHGEWIDLTGTW
ncbi:MAG: hypothetical protein WAO15_08705 [Mycobacterium sp.]